MKGCEDLEANVRTIILAQRIAKATVEMLTQLMSSQFK